jgi:hypothetical protein
MSDDLKIPKKSREKKAYREGFKVGSRKVSMFPNLFKKSGRNQLKIVFKSEGGWSQFLPSNIDKSLKSPFMQGVKAGAKEYYSNKKKN